MTKDDVQNLCEACYSLIQDGKKMEAIKLFRNTTGDNLQTAKNAIDMIEEGTTPMVHMFSVPDPKLLELYGEAVMTQLASIKGLTVHETLFHVPTLKVFVLKELDRWYIIYKEALAASVFAESKIQFSEWDSDVTFGDTGDDWAAKVACDYTNIIRKISDHCRYLATMKKENFPGVKA